MTLDVLSHRLVKSDQGVLPIISSANDIARIGGKKVKEPLNVSKPITEEPKSDDVDCVHCEKTMTRPFQIGKDFFELSDEVIDVDAEVFIVLEI